MTESASAREQARTSSGRFGVQARTEADEVSLDAGGSGGAPESTNDLATSDLPVILGATVGTWEPLGDGSDGGDDENAYFLRNLITSHDQRGQGSASRYMERSLAIADARGLRLDTVPGNPGLQRWYESLGFVVDPDERGIGARPYMTRAPRARLVAGA